MVLIYFSILQHDNLTKYSQTVFSHVLWETVMKVWIVDDDQDFSSYLKGMLKNQPHYSVLGMSHSLEQAYEDLAHVIPDLVTIDLSLPDGSGVELVKWLEERQPNVKKIIISFWGQENLVYEAITNGANGYLQKDHLLTMEMNKAILTLESGGTPISPKLAKYFLQHFQDKIHNQALSNIHDDESMTHHTESSLIKDYRLSTREIEVLEQLALGLSYNEIAQQLDVSYHTISSHIKKIYKKLNVSSKVEAIITLKNSDWV